MTIIMVYYKNLLSFIFILFYLTSCVSLPGINKSISKKKPNQKIIQSKYSISDVGINIIDINSLSEKEINSYNKAKVEEIDYKIKKF